MTTSNDEILNTLHSDTRKAFDMIMRAYMQRVYWHIRRIVVSHQDAEDATQETFVRIYRALNDFRKGNLTVWIFRIASHEAYRIIDKRTANQCDIEGAKSVASDSYCNYTDGELIRFRDAILSLPKMQQTVFNLRYYDDMSYDDIASIVDSTPQSAKANYYIAKTKIIKYIEGND